MSIWAKKRAKQLESGLCSVPYCKNPPIENRKLCVSCSGRNQTQYIYRRTQHETKPELITCEQYLIIDKMKKDRKLLGEIFHCLGKITRSQMEIISKYYYRR